MRLLLEQLLCGWGYDVTVVVDGLAAVRELVKPDAPKVAILDWMMPGLDGPDVIRRVRDLKPDSDIYMLLLTGKTGNGDIASGRDSGADDVLTKPIDPQELQARLRVGERIASLESNLAHALKVSEFRADHDALTGLYNRRTILALLEREKSRSAREDSALGVMIADIDSFKDINDAHGNTVGDRVLLEVAGRMKSSLRGYDLLGRYGGEEFLMVAPGCKPQHALAISERLRRAVAKSPIRVGDVILNVTISLGSTTISSTEAISDCLKRADQALLESGRNTCRFRSSVQEAMVHGNFLLPSPIISETLAGNA